MHKEEFLFLNQLVNSLAEAGESLEKAYDRKDIDNFNKSKKMILRIQEEISNIIR